MKIAIISDIHDNLANLEKCLVWLKKEQISTIICCGDLTNSDTMKFFAANFKDRVYLIMGNADNYDENEPLKYRNIKMLDRKGGRLDIDGKVIGVCHEPYHIKHLFHQGKFDLIFYGHTHKPWESVENGVKLINPGTLGGLFQMATFALWDSQTLELELKILGDL